MKLFRTYRKLPALALCLLVLILMSLYALWNGRFQVARVTAQEVGQNTPEFVPVSEPGGYVIRELNGQSICQEATPVEAAQLQQTYAPQNLEVIYEGRTNALVAAEAQTGLRITLRASSQLDNFPEAKAAFIRAAQNWEAQILSPISMVVDVDFGPTFFGENYPNANTIGQTASQTIGSTTGYPNIRATLLSGASSNAETSFYSALPAGQIPTDQGDVTSVFTSSAVFRALGLISPNANPDTEQQQLGSPPRIGFNSAFPFDFDPGNGIDSAQIDFDFVATHEIGHALGFSSFVGEKELSTTAAARLSVLDLFRFRPGITLNTLSSAQRILASGGTQVLFAGGAELGLSTGRPDATGGDRNQASHWKADELTGTYIGIMDPTAGRGQRGAITPNDLQAFDIIGYRVRSAQQQIDASPRALDFGDAPLNTNIDRTLTVLNTGGQTLQVSGVTISNARFRLISPGTAFTLAPNSQQNVVVRFTPTANGAQTGTMTLASNDPNRPTLAVALNGFGGSQPTVALTSGAAQNGSIPAPPVANDCQLDPTQYSIQVPTNATQLRVTMTGSQDLDLYGRFGQRVTGLSPDWVADHVSDSPNSSETITVLPTSNPTLRAGTYFFGITNCGPGAATYSITATVTGGSNPMTVASAASFRTSELTADSIASAFGQNLATATLTGTTNPLPTTLAGTAVKVRDSAGTERLAALFFVSAGQINFLIPAGTSVGTATVTATNGNGVTATGSVNIVAAAPGVFAANSNGQGVAAAVTLRVRTNNTQLFENIAVLDPLTSRLIATPIDLGPAGEQVFLILFGTGFRNRSSLNAVSAQVGGSPATVTFAGSQGVLLGLDQANILLPRTLLGRGEVDVVLTVDGKAANTVRINIK